MKFGFLRPREAGDLTLVHRLAGRKEQRLSDACSFGRIR